MRLWTGWIVAFLMVAFVAGCGGGGGASLENGSANAGGVKFSLDLATLDRTAKTAADVTPAPITAVSVVLTRSGYSDISQDLTVENNVASGIINGLASGYWHVTATVYSNSSALYTGAVDVKVIAGAQVSAQILFDPVEPTPPSTGSLALSVGYNKFPGWSKLNQVVNTILQDTAKQKFYIMDSSISTLAVYDAGTMVREKDIVLANPPQALAVEPAGGTLLLGYSSGKIYRLKVADESLTLVADSLVSVSALVPVSSTYALVASSIYWGPSNTYKTINLGTGQIVDSKSYWYPLSNFTFNPATGMVYGLDSGLSPADLHRIRINQTSGAIELITDSRYHGDYYYGAPIRVLNNGSRVATGSGNMFISSALDSDDITYAGNLGHTFADLASDDALGNLYMLNSDNIKKLLVINQASMFTTLSLDLVAEPQRVFNTPNGIVVFVKSSSDYYVRVFNKQSLGLQ